jgi:hypothetical protein
MTAEPGPGVPEDDETLLAELRRIAREADPVPPDALAAARAALTTRDLDRLLADLVADSAVPAAAAASAGLETFEPVRSAVDDPATRRLLSFTGAGVEINLEIEPDEAALLIFGQVTGATVGSCRLEHARGERHVPLDALGRFLVTGVGHGPVRLHVRTASGADVATAWVTV